MISDSILQYIISMPKIDLHCHLDGSFSEDFVINALNHGIEREDLPKKLRAPEICRDLAEYLERFSLPVSCLQTRENIRAGVYDVVKNAARENIKYIEIRFAPGLSLNPSMNYRDIFEAAIEGTKAAKRDFKVYSSIIACAMRHHSTESNIAMLNSARDFLNEGVCALDLAGDEAAFGNTMFAPLFERANKLGMPLTIHSGECQSVENVRLAMEYGAKRIGHGIALIKDRELMSLIKKAGIGLELCPTSNYQTRAVSRDEIYPLKEFLDYGLLTTVNTDNRTVSNTTITNEYIKIVDELGITRDELGILYKNSVETAFAPDEIKHELLGLI